MKNGVKGLILFYQDSNLGGFQNQNPILTIYRFGLGGFRISRLKVSAGGLDRL